MEIHRATADDALAIAKVHVRSWHETYTGLLPQAMLDSLSVENRSTSWKNILSSPQSFPSTAAFVACRENEVVGFGACNIQRTEELRAAGFDGEISALYVLHDEQGKGTGKALVKAMADELKSRSLRGGSVWVLRQNINACGFYEHCGGRVAGEKKDVRPGVTLEEIAYGWRSIDDMSK
ncbi:GNAT family N-acetyltransferase [Phyllobacterium salinisoli]|uniref:GNAT family N-acetyltransferase n=1 Tax=Phyllobacterium salinisoli TaxID=1899321 RepID=A0A368JW42_9HYPH|nr:GNAT family N-acetyltransferase [Phyllobacterium salinisoli]RCS21367.1 GNAT family N-acetyltransferase [Phyllobacterium salinisoli]